jgi:hypothetical protein
VAEALKVLRDPLALGRGFDEDARWRAANTSSKAAPVLLMRRSVNSPLSSRAQIWLEVLCRSIPMKSMAGLLCAGKTRMFKEQGIMPQSSGRPLHPIQLCKRSYLTPGITRSPARL